MVRLFTSSTGKVTASSSSPETASPGAASPPPYQDTIDSSPPVILAETTTTSTRTEVVTTTTQTTTHYFRSPQKNISEPTLVVHHRFPDTKEEEYVALLQGKSSNSYMVNKALPPTPPEDPDTIGQDGEYGKRRSATTARGSTLSTGGIDTALHSIPSSTVTLAHAALGLGFPHTIPRASSSSGVNTITFSTPSSRHPDIPTSSPIIRRAKSSQKIGMTYAGAYSESDTPTVRQRRRTRGLSFGASLFSFATGDGKEKWKEKEVANGPLQSSPKPLSRRSSFWTRKKSVTSTSHSNTTLPLPPLPPLQPVSPFEMDIVLGSSSSPVHPPLQSSHVRGLSRSHSERMITRRKSSQIMDVISDASISSRGLPKRPVTADTSISQSTERWASYFDSGLPSQSLSIPRNQVEEGKTEAKSSRVHSQLSTPSVRTDSPLLHRLSLNVFSSASDPYPLSHRTSVGHAHSPVGHISSPTMDISLDVPKPSTQESPGIYLHRLRAAVSKAEVAGILASSSDPFYVQTLRMHINQFNFIDDPLDVALRKLLLHVGLPRETQQIDRVIEAFAARYMECNPNLFTSEDHPYILAFSLIMLHTDAFNRSNKRKMTKVDYIRNTKLPGVDAEILDYFYDNIIFAPFIFIEDPLEINGQRKFTSELNNKMSSAISNPTTSSAGHGGSNSIPKINKVDAYYLITNNLLESLRVNVECHVPKENPYSYEGTAGPWNDDELQRTFAKANVIELGTAVSTVSSPMFSLTVTGAPSSPLISTMGFPYEIPQSTGEILHLKVSMVGVLNRKDDVLEGGKKASNRKWKAWSVLLTGSQLLFFRDSSWAASLLAQFQSSNEQIAPPHLAIFRPDELFSVKDAVAVFDKSYIKYENAMRFVMPDGRQLLLQTSEEALLNQWISRINYASAFKSAGLKMRSMGMSGKDVQLTGVAAATSHLHDIQRAQYPGKNLNTWDSDTPRDLMGMLAGQSKGTKHSPPQRRVTLMSVRDNVDVDVPVAPEVDGAEQFKATFDNVKADLAAVHSAMQDEPVTGRESGSEQLTAAALTIDTTRQVPPRASIIQTKVEELDIKIASANIQLETYLRSIRNIAILAPFQRTTRERLLLSVQNKARYVMNLRLELAKHICHREVLSNDLLLEQQSWSSARELALKVAKETLQSKQGGSTPHMTISRHSIESDNFKHPESSQQRRAESSTSESFHSAMDFGPHWLSSDELTSSTFLSATQSSDSPRPSTSGSIGWDVGSPRSPESVRASVLESRSSSIDPSNFTYHERFYTAHEDPEEQAEVWNQTRCAQRVSLVRVPSTFRMSTRFGGHG
ncbi:hypothetical protein BDQ12DRAFT_678725 [Crucibulum laeve]|uniref:SEC7 domain-containing protein n=1 Tax=Crucibulum laeve TaxID=68775 RepID=A0A5C3M6M8_9AGAR|nr:hypothetical protein BDQ12DRAFT_678725 [Crucibulum laeve]